MIGDLLRGSRYLLSGFSLIGEAGVRRYVVIPLLINVLVFAGLFWLAFDWFSSWSAGLAWLHPDPQSRWAFVTGPLLFLLKLLFGAAVLLISAVSFSLVANLLAAPFNSLLAERVEAHLRGTGSRDTPESLRHVIASIPKTLRSELAKLIYVLLRLLPILLLHLIPGVNLIAPLLSFLFGAWMLSLEYLDYPMGNHGFLFRDVRRTVSRRRPLALSFGAAVMLLTAVPLLNLIAMPVAVAAATRIWVEQLADNETATN
ncbi:sulfate transporter CysZ [Granulosicoccaceae sp. 1_MG-2023]|nr:sulfate transporter CysZ [Granulosicoccaceae sp. 1_MG-2023]